MSDFQSSNLYRVSNLSPAIIKLAQSEESNQSPAQNATPSKIAHKIDVQKNIHKIEYKILHGKIYIQINNTNQIISISFCMQFCDYHYSNKILPIQVIELKELTYLLI